MKNDFFKTTTSGVVLVGLLDTPVLCSQGSFFHLELEQKENNSNSLSS